MRNGARRRRSKLCAGLLCAVSIVAAGCGGSGRSASPPTTLRRVSTVRSGMHGHSSTSATGAPTTTVPPPPATAAPSFTTLHLDLVDPTRPTVSHGTTVAQSRSLPTTVWLPANADGQVTGRRLPWIVFLHGYLAEPERYATMLQTWAKAGYGVVAPRFPLTSSASGAVTDEADMVNEPGDVSFLITSVLHPSGPAAGVLAGALDPDRIGVAGHSDGANVAFAVGYSTALGDPRVRTVIDLSGELPTGMGPYPAGGPPLLMIHADQDEFVPHAEAAQLFGAVSTPKWWVELHGVGHEPPFTQTSAWSAVVDEVTIAFLGRTLGDTGVSAAAIDAAASRPPTATLEETNTPAS
ncbi:MAG: hypothetical protein JST73_07805 [Actinobacteria bacterium]|nr:hypothetical protein [Actinomycetota bacterium]